MANELDRIKKARKIRRIIVYLEVYIFMLLVETVKFLTMDKSIQKKKGSVYTYSCTSITIM